MDLDPLEIALRLGAAVAGGLALGLNRDLHDKPIGMRTLALVSLGAALVTVSAIHFQNLIAHPDALSRIVQGVVQGIMGGISFIGAGVILHDAKSRNVEGLTTAATVWIAAAIGIACGLAAWISAGLAITFSLVVLVGVRWLETMIIEKRK